MEKTPQEAWSSCSLIVIIRLTPVYLCHAVGYCIDFPGGSDSKAYAYNARDPGPIPGLGRSAGEGNGNSLQYSCLENPMDRGAWAATVHRVAESDTTEAS